MTTWEKNKRDDSWHWICKYLYCRYHHALYWLWFGKYLQLLYDMHLSTDFHSSVQPPIIYKTRHTRITLRWWRLETVTVGSWLNFTCSQKQDSVKVFIQRRLLVHGDLDVVDAPLEHKWPQVYWVNLLSHQRVPPGKCEHAVWEVSRGVYALGPVYVCDTL